jgi:NitT/TauT family transport system permease protein
MKKLEKIYPLLSFILFLAFWQLVVLIKKYPSFILPSPKQTANRLLTAITNGTLLFHSLITLQEIFIGLILGTTLAFSFGLIISKSVFFKKLFSPLFVSFQAIPVLALAPLILIWFGSGIWAKAFVCGATLFFPVLINTVTGLENISRHYYQILDLQKANFWQKLTLVEIPASLPIIFSGLKIGVTLSVIGAVVGEFVGADKGLGFLINLAGGLYDTPLRFASFFTLSLIALTLYSTVAFLEKKLINWRP